MESRNPLVERIRAGLSTIVLGARPNLPPSIAAIRVDCEATSTRGPLERARRMIEGVLDGTHLMDERDDGTSARRRTLSGESEGDRLADPA